jgi:hypothetical protein
VPNYRQQPEYRRFGCEQREHKSIFDFAALRFAGSLRGAFPDRRRIRIPEHYLTCERSIVTMDAKIETTGNEQMEHEQRARTADFIERARVKQKSSRPS